MKFCKKINLFRKFNIEAIVWLLALMYLFIINPYSSKHFTFCIFKLLGFDFCPGCGLGLSISFLLHFDFANSFHTHYLGIPALILITHRIFVLMKQDSLNKKYFQSLNFKEHTND